MEIRNVKTFGQDKVCKAGFTLMFPQYDDMTVECALFEVDSSKWWINYAARQYQAQDGKKKYWNMVNWPQEIKERISAEARELFRQTANGKEDLLF
jgi:hypothetical protein